MTSQSSTFRVSQYAPANETEADLMYERLNINGAVLGGVGYGVHATLFFMCLSLLLKVRKKDPKRSWVFVAYITINFVLGSIGNGANIRFNEMIFVGNRDYPGGPNAFFMQQNSCWVNMVSYGVFIVNTWTQDGLLLYRFLVIFRFNYWVVVIPSMLYLVSIIMSCLLLTQISKPNTTVFSHVSVNYAVTYWSVSIATTLLVTILIVSRLLVMRYKLHVGSGEGKDSPYVSISAMFIESAGLYSAVALIFIITFAKNDPAQNLVLPVLGQVQSVSPLLIILRVVQGCAWGRDTLRSTYLGPASTKFNVYNPSSTGSGGYALSGLQSEVDGPSSKSASPTFGYPGEVRPADIEDKELGRPE
ncbi:hypothetical protein JB92DRAFT_3004859 [Gautieria morchelliformis]|nr:hypothetical protein JB92DRAFT_3004859 [Gautieria morchelliformis]